MPEQNVSGVNGCYALSNSIEVTRTENMGGDIALDDGTVERTVCVGAGIPNLINFESTNAVGENFAWVITDPDGQILGLPAAPPVSLEAAGTGTCLIWNISYSDGLTGLVPGANVNNLEGCHDFSNPITVTRNGVNGGDIEFDNGTNEVTICVGDGIADPLNVNLINQEGTNSAWVITNETGDIVGLPSAPPFDLEGAETGICQIWNISYYDGLTGLEMDSNVANLVGCFALSNPLTVTRVNEGVACTTSTNDLVDNAAFEIHPNPTSGFVNVNINRTFSGTLDMRLLDVSGRVIVAKQTNAMVENMDLTNLVAGVYFLEISNEFFIGTKRIVKQ